MYHAAGAQLDLEERTSVARMRPNRERHDNGGESNGGGGGRGRGRGRRGGGGGGGGGSGGGAGSSTGANGEGIEHVGENGGSEGGEGRGRRMPPVAENSVYIKGFPETTSEDDIRAEVSKTDNAERWARHEVAFTDIENIRSYEFVFLMVT